MSEQNDQENEVASSESASINFCSMEKEILSFWQEKNIFKKSLDQTRSLKPYIFYDGPPFATGLPHHGHLVGSTLKDIVPRYWTMKGRYVERRFGWDCHGLPIEHEIDKKLGMSAQDAVAKLGVKGYNDECRGIVQRYVKEWEKTITRIGRWVDFENDYKTMDSTFMESVWWVFKQLWDKGLIYQGTKVVPFSTALGTVLSNFEASSNYQDVQDPTVTVLFELEDEKAYMAAWTTTPWTLPSNLALCVGPDIDYVKVKDEDKNIEFYLAKLLLPTVGKKKNLTVIKELKGKDLLGKRYKPLFDYFKHLKDKGAFVVLNDGYVTTDSGTGVVHTAPDFGEDDARVVKEAGLDLHACPVDDAGKFTNEVLDFKGQHVKEADKNIIKWLKDKGALYEQSTLVHPYPMCPRSDTPLIYKAIPSWYVNVEKIKQDLMASNQEIYWVPSHIKDGRFGKWLEGARDWSISRNRVWGTPLPIWTNLEAKQSICVGSIEELEKLTGTKLSDLHRENVDPLTFKMDGVPGTFKRTDGVLDCWFESGSMPYAQLHYPFENQEMFKQGFPAEYIAEGLDQTRGWFYTLTVLSTALFSKPAFKHVIVNGIVMAQDGKKMSKRLKNYTPPDELMETFGADSLRLYLINSGLTKAEEQRFADSGVRDMARRVLLPWYNSFKFFQTYAKVDGFDAKRDHVTSDNIMDRWILSNLQTLKQNIEKEMQDYHLFNVVPALFTFIEDLTNWYIRLNRSRFWAEGLDQDKKAAYSTLYTCLKEITLNMAPFTPFLAEHIFLALKGFNEASEESVHLCSYPVADSKLTNATLEKAVERMQQVILLGRQKRVQTQIKVKTPLSSITILHREQNILDEIKKLEEYIKIELNVKEVIYSTHESEYIRLYLKPNLPVLGKRLGKDMGKYKALLEKLPVSEIEKLEEKGEITLEGQVFGTGDVLVYREALAGKNALSNRLISIDLNCQLTEELKREGLAREVVGKIQKLRKEMNLQVDDRIVVKYQAQEDLAQAIAENSAYIQAETLSNQLQQSNDLDLASCGLIEKWELKLKLSKV